MKSIAYALTSFTVVCALYSQTVEDRRVAPIVAHKQVALVIGNAAYPNRPLANPLSDAQAMSRRLRELNFDVTLVTNADRKTMGKAVDQFVDKLGTGDVGFFYYSGHGMQVDGENYLIPVDFQGQNETDVRYDAHSASRIQDRMEKSGAQLNILVLDACRDNPFHSVSRGGGGGLAAMSAGQGTFIAFATAPGHTASDNPNGKNGLFTQYLLEALSAPGLSLNDVFDLVREKVHSASDGRQVPWMLSSVIGRYSFLPGASINRVRTNEPSAPIDLEAWQAVKDTGDVDLLKQFITLYPQSSYVGVAKLKIAALSKSPPATGSTATVPGDVSIPQAQKTGQVRINPKDDQPYVWIPPGGFYIGCSPGDNECWPNENPSHSVTIPRGFWMGQTPVTQAAYSRVMGMNPSSHPGEKLPVERVTWDEAKRYCEAVGGRLPSEAEWEYAARAGTTGPRYGDLDAISWYASNSGNQTRPVGTKAPNAWNLYDMLGNVWQWTAEWSGETYWPSSGQARVLRGGCVNNVPRRVRVSVRNPVGPSDRVYVYGFRCVGE